MLNVLTITRRAMLVLWLALVGLVLALVLTTHVGGFFGYRIVILRGTSMAPTIPLGAIGFEQAIRPSQIVPGDVVTFALPSGTLVTHRVIRVADQDGQRLIETRGDANNAADPTLQPATSVSGVVRSHLPIAGFMLAFLGIPTGILCVVSMLGSLLAAIWLLEDVAADRRLATVVADSVPHGLPA